MTKREGRQWFMDGCERLLRIHDTHLHDGTYFGMKLKEGEVWRGERLIDTLVCLLQIHSFGIMNNGHSLEIVEIMKTLHHPRCEHLLSVNQAHQFCRKMDQNYNS